MSKRKKREKNGFKRRGRIANAPLPDWPCPCGSEFNYRQCHDRIPLRGISSIRSGDVNLEVREVAFPLVEWESESRFRVIGTAFFVRGDGLFVTAAHCFTIPKPASALDLLGSPPPPDINREVGAITFSPEGFVAREINWEYLRLHDEADIAVGRLVPLASPDGELLANHKVTVSTEGLEREALIACVGYPEETKWDLTDDCSRLTIIMAEDDILRQGRVMSFRPNGIPKMRLRGPCVEAALRVSGGLSGGPVINERGAVCGVLSSGFSLDMKYPLAGIARMTEALEVALPVVEDGVKREVPLRGLGGVHLV